MSEKNELKFDKFMDDIVAREEAGRAKLKEYAENHADSPQRRMNELYREKPHNRIKYER